MPSRSRAEPLDSFEADVPITAEDIAVQGKIRETAAMSSTEYLEWCRWITRDFVSPCRDFHSEPFEL
jgi:hypothetical protein